MCVCVCYAAHFVFVGSFMVILSLHRIHAYLHVLCIYGVVHGTTCLLLEVAHNFQQLLIRAQKVVYRGLLYLEII